MKTITHSGIAGFLIAAAVLLPSVAHAAVSITEIMYDVPGTDTGREWIEITNTGSAPVDVSGYKFFEGNTNHGLTLLTGSGVLAPQSSAVIVEDQTKFTTDNPSFSGTLFKSSFSLTNTGEALAIKDGALATQDSISYDSGMGAAGDGNSLHRSNAAFIPGPPTPGVYSENPGAGNQSQNQNNAPMDTDQTSAQNAMTGASGTLAPAMTVDLGGNRTVESGAGSFFMGHIYNAEGVALPNARYIWNFGDGETKEGQKVFYAYPYPGTYVVVLEVDAGNGYSKSGTVTVEAVPAEVSLRAENDGALTVANTTHTGNNLDLSLWQLSRGGKTFTIPEGTQVLPGKAVRFAPALLTFPNAGEAQLSYPNGILAASTGVHAIQGGITYVDYTAPAAARAFAPPQAAIASSTPTLQAAAVAAAPATKAQSSLPLSVAGLAALVLIGAAGVLYVRLSGTPASPDAGDMPIDYDALAAEFSIAEAEDAL